MRISVLERDGACFNGFRLKANLSHEALPCLIGCLVSLNALLIDTITAVLHIEYYTVE